jgi:hypothetical protein
MRWWWLFLIYKSNFFFILQNKRGGGLTLFIHRRKTSAGWISSVFPSYSIISELIVDDIFRDPPTSPAHLFFRFLLSWPFSPWTERMEAKVVDSWEILREKSRKLKKMLKIESMRCVCFY